MKIIVVYDSVFGNTEKAAAFMGEALGATLTRVTDTVDIKDADMLLVGSPTRAFRPTPAITAWLKKLPAGTLSGLRAAAFDTRISAEEADSAVLKKMMKRFGYAAQRIHKALKKKGADMAAEPEGFYVAQSEGPLKDGEMQRALAWARSFTQS